MPLTIDTDWFQASDRLALRWLRRALQDSRTELEAEVESLAIGSTRRSFSDLFESMVAALDGDSEPLRSRLALLGSHAAYVGVELRSLYEATARIRRLLTHQLIAAFGHDRQLLEGVLTVMEQLFDHGSWVITHEYLLHREAQTEQQRRSEAREHERAEQLRLRAVQLEAENTQIREVSRVKSEFVANMSHELRTPLNSIIGFADLLHDDEVPPSEQRELLADILRSARHLLKMINDVLDLAKVEAGKLEFCPETVKIEPIVHQVVDALRGLAVAAQVSLVIELDPELDEAWLDPARLRQVLYNYLSNALKFTQASGQVCVRARFEGTQWLLLEVDDSGVGIPASELGRLFKDFEQLSGTRGGTGLGLALTRRIVQAQGGDVGVRSEPGSGSTFWARWPVVSSAERASRPSSYFEQLRPRHGLTESSEFETVQTLQRRGP